MDKNSRNTLPRRGRSASSSLYIIHSKDFGQELKEHTTSMTHRLRGQNKRTVWVDSGCRIGYFEPMFASRCAMRLRAMLSNVLINLLRSRPSIVFYDLLGVDSEAYSPLSLAIMIPLLLVDSSYSTVRVRPCRTRPTVGRWPTTLS